MDSNNDDIRPPDAVITERLFDFNNTDLNSELNTAIEMSKNEYNLLQEQEQQLRQRKFHNIKIQINKIILFDRPNLRYYELILTIIEMF